MVREKKMKDEAQSERTYKWVTYAYIDGCQSAIDYTTCTLHNCKPTESPSLWLAVMVGSACVASFGCDFI